MEEKVKEIIEKVRQSAVAAGELAAGAYESAGKVAGEVVETTKLNLQIFDLNNDVSTLYRKIGELIYKAHADSETDTTQLDEWLKVIDDKKAAVEETKQRIAELKRTRKCSNPECGVQCSKNDSFCPKCGTKL